MTKNLPGDDRVRFTLHDWVKGQLTYFTKAKNKEHRAHKLSARCSLLVYSLSIAAAVGWVIGFRIIEQESPGKHFLVVVMALGVALSAAFEAISQKMGHAEHSKSYERIERIYGKALKTGEAYLQAGDTEGARRIFRTLGEVALEENADWLALHRSRPIDAPKG